MPYVVVDDFRLGMDRRRPAVAGIPGSLWTLKNAHISRGGDVVGRKKFVSEYSVPNTLGLQAAGGSLYVFGHRDPVDVTIPVGVTYQQCAHPDGRGMTQVVHSDAVDGLPYVVAKYSDDSIHHFYDGVVVTDWDDGIVRGDMTDNDGIAEHLKDLIDGNEGITATRTGAVVTLTGTAGTAFTAVATTQNVEGGTDDQTLTLATTAPAIAGIAEVLSSGSVEITGGTSSPGVNKVTSLTVDSVEMLSADVDWLISDAATAEQIAFNITNNTTTPNYTATAAAGVITITAAAGTGAGPNTFVVAITVAGDVTAGTPVAFAGGVTAVAGQSQVTTATVAGTFEAGDKFNIAIDGTNYGYVGKPSPKGTFIKPYGTNVYAVSGSLVNISAVNTPTLWNRDVDDPPGSAFINISSESLGSDELVAIGDFIGNVAIFAKEAVQTWSMDPDPLNNARLQTLLNTGCRAARAVVQFGNVDTFYLDTPGIRSLRPRDSSNAPFSSDVGNSIDLFVQEHMETLTDAQIERAVGIVEPVDGRYWLALGDRVYVFSYFPESKISAWSYYELDTGITDLTILNRIVYARAGDDILAYGGLAGTTYPAAGEDETVAQLPYLSAKKDAHFKHLSGLDFAVEGDWTVEVLVNADDEDHKLYVGPVVNSTTYDAPDIPISHEVTHVAPKLTSTSAGARKLINCAIHYMLGTSG